MSPQAFKKMMQEAFVIENAVVEAIEDMGLVRAMEEGRGKEHVEVKEFKKRLDARIKRAR